MTDISKINYISQGTFDTKTQVDDELDFVNIGGSLSMPSHTYDTLTLGASGTTYTAPADGYFLIYYGTSASGTWSVINNTTTDFRMYPPLTTAVGDGYGYFLPVIKGDTVAVYYSNLVNPVFRFVYAVGSESEA